MTFFLDNDSSYAIPVTTDSSNITIIAGPLVEAKWNYYGVLYEHEFDPHAGAIYYNKYLSPAVVNGPLILERAAVGCVNLALGQIMYALKYPNSDSCDKKLDVKHTFEVTEVKEWLLGFVPQPFFSSIRRSFKSPELYNWNIMATDPKYSNDYMVNVSQDIASRDEVARLLYDIEPARLLRAVLYEKK
jgi:hypothetical protein